MAGLDGPDPLSYLRRAAARGTPAISRLILFLRFPPGSSPTIANLIAIGLVPAMLECRPYLTSIRADSSAARVDSRLVSSSSAEVPGLEANGEPDRLHHIEVVPLAGHLI